MYNFQLGDKVKFNPYNNRIDEYNDFITQPENKYNLNDTYTIVECDSTDFCDLFILENNNTKHIINNYVSHDELLYAHM